MPKWNVTISEETDRLARSHLARGGLKKGDLSALVNEAVRERIIRQMAEQIQQDNPDATKQELERTLASEVRRNALGELIREIRERNEDDHDEEIQAEIDEAVAWVRAHPA